MVVYYCLSGSQSITTIRSVLIRVSAALRCTLLLDQERWCRLLRLLLLARPEAGTTVKASAALLLLKIRCRGDRYHGWLLGTGVLEIVHHGKSATAVDTMTPNQALVTIDRQTEIGGVERTVAERRHVTLVRIR